VCDKNCVACTVKTQGNWSNNDRGRGFTRLVGWAPLQVHVGDTTSLASDTKTSISVQHECNLTLLSNMTSIKLTMIRSLPPPASPKRQLLRGITPMRNPPNWREDMFIDVDAGSFNHEVISSIEPQTSRARM